MTRPEMLELCGCQGGATVGYQRAGWRVTAVDLDAEALALNPADVTVCADALVYLAAHGHKYDAIHASFPCQRWCANGANPAANNYPDLVTPVLCGVQFGLTAIDTDGTLLHLKRHRVFESNVPLISPGPCAPHSRRLQWAGVYSGARKDKIEARMVRKGGYTPPDADVQSALLGGVPWMTDKGRRECVPPVYAQFVGAQLLAHVQAVAA